MSIKIEILDPHTESPQALRTIAHFLNCLASDRDGNPQQYSVTPGCSVTLQQTAAPITQENLPANPGNGHAAPGASAGSTQTSDANVPGGETALDKNGLPWDERIHSSSKNLNADGTWRYLRGGDTDLRAKVEAELRERMAGSTAGADTVSDLTSDAPPPPPPIVTPAADAPPPPPPINGAAQDAPEESTGIDFKQVFGRVTALQKHATGNLLPTEKLTEVLELAGVEPPTMAGFMKNRELATVVWEAIDAIVGEV